MIYLVRHGETTWNRVGRQQGHLDSPLTPKGIEQARAAGRALRRALPALANVCIETSPLGRARLTATILCDELGLDEGAIVIAPLLIEANFGAWQGHTHAEIDAQYPGARQAREAHKWHYVVPGVRATSSSSTTVEQKASVSSTSHVAKTGGVAGPPERGVAPKLGRTSACSGRHLAMLGAAAEAGRWAVK
jgi:probable phosphoglycerate mutase